MKVRARNGPDASAWRYRQACMTGIAPPQRVCRSRASDLPTRGASGRRCSRKNCKFRAISVGEIARLTLGDVAGDEHQRAGRPGRELRNRDAKADAVEMESARAATAVCSLPPCGGGLGRGVVVMAQSCIRQLLPPPPTPPHKGEGSTPCAARNCPASNSTGTALVRNPFRLNRDFAPSICSVA